MKKPKGRPVREPREVKFRDASAAIVHHCRRIHDDIARVASFYQGDDEVAVPEHKQRIEYIINPKRNGADDYLQTLGEACKAYLPGECPEEPLLLVHDETISLIEDDLEPAHRDKALNVSSTVMTDFTHYMLKPNPTITPDQHALNVDEHIQRLQRRFCQNSDAFYSRTSTLLERRPSRRNPSVRDARNGEGRDACSMQTTGQKCRRKIRPRMTDWVETERTAVLEYADDPKRNRAGKLPHELCVHVWNLNRAEFEKAAMLPIGQRGYKNAASLRAYFYSQRAKYAKRKYGMRQHL